MMNEIEKVSALVPSDIRPLIHEIRGIQVMLDRDLAFLYGVTTGALNQAVKRNIERFPERFMFQMSPEEFANWKSQSVISNSADDALTSQNATSKLGESTVRMGLRKRPFVFTEHGVTMLAAVLHSETAVRVSIEIIDAFIAMRRTLASMGHVLTRLDAVERRQITDQAKNDSRFDEIFAKFRAGDADISHIFYQGKFWEAKSLLIKFVRRAKKDLVVIDPYVGVATLDILAKRTRGVKVELITHSNGELAESDFEAFAKQYGHFTKTLSGTCHDRFIIVDKKEIFVIGASLKDAARQTFSATRIGPELIPGLLDSLRKSAKAMKRYA